MKKSNLLKNLGKISDYFFGFGDDSYKETLDFYNRFCEGYERLVGISSSKLDKLAKIAIRSGITAAEYILSYSYVKTQDPSLLLIIPIGEAFRFLSVYFDERNLKYIKKRKREIISKWKHQSLDEIKEDYDRRLEEKLYR